MPRSDANSPAVRTVFFSDAIIPLSPVACKRTFVKSSGLRGSSSSATTVYGVNLSLSTKRSATH